MNHTDYTEYYLENKKVYIEAASKELSSFIVCHFGEAGEHDYSELRKSNIRERGAFSATIPWIIADLCGLRADECIGIASSWEAILLYVRQLDSLSDKKNLTEKDKMMLLTASTLLIHGIDQLKTILGSESSSYLFPLFESAKFQKQDLELANLDLSVNEDVHLQIMKGKNIFVKVISEFYLKRSRIDRQLLNDFIDNLAIFAQLIDDIKDIEDDISNSCYSHLRYELEKEEIKVDNSSSVYSILVSSGILRRSIDLSICFLSNSIRIASQVNLGVSTDSKVRKDELTKYLMCQKRQLKELLFLVKDLESFNHFGGQEEAIVKKKIKHLCIGT